MIVSVVMDKGGSGKTLVATNIACALAKCFLKKKICLLDINHQCGVSNAFGKRRTTYNGKSVLTAIINPNIDLYRLLEQPTLNKQKNAFLNNLYVLNSEYEMRQFDIASFIDKKLKINFSNLIKKLNEEFDFVVIDGSSGFGTANLIILKHSDLVLSPFELETSNIDSCVAVGQELTNPNFKKKPPIYVIPNNVSLQNPIQKCLLEVAKTKIDKFRETTYDKIYLTDLMIENTSKYPDTVAFEKVPMYLSNKSDHIIKEQRQVFDDLVKLIVSLS